MKVKLIVHVFLAIMLVSLISANSIDIEFPQGNEFDAGEPITLKATLYDDSGKPIDGQIELTIEDSEKKITKISISSKEVSTINLVDAASGQGVITAEAQGAKTIAFFEIGREEQVKFEIIDGKLIVTNIGNTPYSKTIKITIGETVATQEANVELGESKTYRLIAPDGVYNIRVTDGKTSISAGSVRLTGTGNVIGAIDDSISGRTPLTGVANPDQGNELALLASLKRNKFVYIFIAVIFAGAILVAIERKYKKASPKK